MDQALGEIVGRGAAALVEGGAAFLRQALDPGLDGDAARRPEEVEQVGLPQVDPGLDPEADIPRDQRLQKRLLRQEDLVDEVDVGDALRDQPVDLVEDDPEIPAPVGVAEVDLGAERAGVGTAARGLDLGARAVRRGVEPVVVVPVPGDPVIRPAQGRQVGEAAGLGRAGHRDRLAVADREAGHGPQGFRAQVGQAGEPGDDLLALAAHDDVAAELVERRTRRRGAVGADRDGGAAPARQGVEEQAGHPQLRRGAAPEQVGGGGRHHGHGGGEGRDAVGGGLGGQALEMRVHEQRLVAGGRQQRGGVAEFERQVRLAAAEIDAVAVVPGRVDQRDSHAAAPAIGAAPSDDARAAASQPARSATPSRQPVKGRGRAARRPGACPRRSSADRPGATPGSCAIPGAPAGCRHGRGAAAGSRRCRGRRRR